MVCLIFYLRKKMSNLCGMWLRYKLGDSTCCTIGCVMLENSYGNSV
jgi:hypothetical protein